jgi:hypothetical protein
MGFLWSFGFDIRFASPWLVVANVKSAPLDDADHSPRQILAQRSRTIVLLIRWTRRLHALKRHCEAECLCGLVVDDPVERRRELNWQFSRLCTIEDATGIETDLVICPREGGTIAHQATSLNIFAPWVDCGLLAGVIGRQAIGCTVLKWISEERTCSCS